MMFKGELFSSITPLCREIASRARRVCKGSQHLDNAVQSMYENKIYLEQVLDL